jgi:hypothetical protein
MLILLVVMYFVFTLGSAWTAARTIVFTPLFCLWHFLLLILKKPIYSNKLCHVSCDLFPASLLVVATSFCLSHASSFFWLFLRFSVQRHVMTHVCLVYVVRDFSLVFTSICTCFLLFVTSLMMSLISRPLAIKAARFLSLFVSSARPTAQLRL